MVLEPGGRKKALAATTALPSHKRRKVPGLDVYENYVEPERQEDEEVDQGHRGIGGTMLPPPPPSQTLPEVIAHGTAAKKGRCLQTPVPVAFVARGAAGDRTATLSHLDGGALTATVSGRALASAAVPTSIRWSSSGSAASGWLLVGSGLDDAEKVQLLHTCCDIFSMPFLASPRSP